MKLGARVTLFFLGSILCVNLLVLIGLPSFFSALIKGQMESHARTYVAFIKKEIEDLPSHNRLAFGDASRPAFDKALVSEFRSAMAVGEEAGGFLVDSIRLLDTTGNIRLGFPLSETGLAAIRGQDLDSVLNGGAIVLYDEAGKRGTALDTTINVLGRAEPFPGSVYVVDVRLDFARSMEMHRSEYNRYEVISIVVAILVELLQAAILLRLLRISALRPVAKISAAMESVAEGRLDTRIDHDAKDEFGTMAKRFNDMVRSLNEKERLSKYVSRSTMKIVKGGANLAEGFNAPVRKELVVFFSDIRGFTSYSENEAPETVIRTLNRMLEIQATVINACGGEIDKFIGDEIMAVFEKPRPALICALKIQGLLANADAYAGLRVGIGMCRGMVVEGDVGFDEQKDFTVIGDAVNTASRLQAIARPGAILVPLGILRTSEMSVFTYSEEGSLQIKGKREKLAVARILGVNEAARRMIVTG